MPVPDHRDILARYNNATLLKPGGQKVAYLVRGSARGDVVVKIGVYNNPRTLERARREVELQREIDSRFYPKHFSFELASANRFVVTEEYIPSKPLADCMGRFAEPRAALVLVSKLVSGLNILWEKRVVHRDVKPDNILIRTDGTPVIIDLGIARLLDSDSLTHTLAARGPCTPFYAAPEQLKNRKANIDARTDQFSIGILLMQLLLGGRHPFDPTVVGGGDSTVDNILAGRWQRGSLEPAGSPVRDLAERLLRPEPYQRYRLAAPLLAAIEAAIEEVS